jgi:hypothetical protein
MSAQPLPRALNRSQDRGFPELVDRYERPTLIQLVVTLGILAVCGFAVGVRPRRQFPAKRIFLFLTQFAEIVLLALWILLSEGSPARLKAWGINELDMIGVYVVLELIALVGVLLLAPIWGYVIGQSVTSRNSRQRASYSRPA